MGSENSLEGQCKVDWWSAFHAGSSSSSSFSLPGLPSASKTFSMERIATQGDAFEMISNNKESSCNIPAGGPLHGGIPLVGSPGTANLRMNRDITYLNVEGDRGKSLVKKSRGLPSKPKTLKWTVTYHVQSTVSILNIPLVPMQVCIDDAYGYGRPRTGPECVDVTL